MLTLRQIEVIRAIMVTGTVGDAARLLNVSSPGISRVMKHAETSLGVKLFDRKAGRYSPTREAGWVLWRWMTVLAIIPQRGIAATKDEAFLSP